MKLVHPGLCALALRRALPAKAIVAWVLLYALLAASAQEAPPSVLLAAGAANASAAAHGLVRADRWGPLAVLVLSWTALCAARSVPHWRAGECDWLGARATTRATILCSTWLGTWIGALLLLGASAAAIELALGAHEPTLERAGEAGVHGPGLLRSGEPWTATLEGAGLAQAGLARIELALAAGPPSVAISARARRGSSSRETRLQLMSHAPLELELPPGEGAVSLELEVSGTNTLVLVLSERAELWRASGSSAVASWQFLAHCALAAALLCALGLGLGAWMGLGSTMLLLGTLTLAVFLGEAPASVWPGADLPGAYAALGEGRASGWPAWPLIGASAAATLGGLALARAGLRRWRSGR